MIDLRNTLSGKKEKLQPLVRGTISLYVCGVTPYDLSHIGHGRVYVTFDLLYRLLKIQGFDVRYCRNFTDIDDKLINRAHKELGDGQRYHEIAQRYITQFHHDIDALNCQRPTIEPRVTQYIPEIITFIEHLIKNGHAYVSGSSVYFSVASIEKYPQLSKQSLQELHAGARVQENEDKKNQFDFALWKGEADKSFFESPWGYGRPGWHIECSVMAYECLGKQIDIHGGGMDLIFPHHDNEIAQTEGFTHMPFARIWMHNAFVQINKEKMSKSLNNFYTLQDVFKHYDPVIVRFYYVSHHYRVPMDFSLDDIGATQKAYQKLVRTFEPIVVDTTTQLDLHNPFIQKLLDYLCDDLNSPGMFGEIFANLAEIVSDHTRAQQVKKLLVDVLGLPLTEIKKETVAHTPEIEMLLEERAQARAAKDFKKADAIRDQLVALGVQLQDTKITK